MNMIVYLALLVGVYIAVIHALALFFELYWRYWWLDLTMHLLGGIFIMLAARSLVIVKSLPARFIAWPGVMVSAVAVLAAWELFGAMILGGFKDGFLIDTAGDMILGLAGVLLGFWLIRGLNRLAA